MSRDRSPTSQPGGINLPAVDPQLENDWAPELEAEFQQRTAAVIDHYADQEYGNAYGENEKRSYPKAMFDFLAGNRQRALKFLQSEDPEAQKHEHTAGIDYYYSFTIKGQIRKYFLLGEELDPAYRERMFRGAKAWTQTDPLTRPHPVYGHGDGSGQDWDISTRGGWVDGRNTDNLRAMREVAVYLMAEETGNESTRLLYKQKLNRYVWALYHIGMGEWDSVVYHGHTFAPYLNLYDFARDPEVKQMAKAALDWLSAAAAVKYYRGGWGGPSKRDYGGGNVVYGSAAARTFSLYFGDVPLPTPNPELDSLYLITSSYRPPQAVVALARKQIEKPVEIFSTKPVYENWKPGADRQPGYWETTFISNTYQMGSVVGTFPDGDLAPFKLMAYNSERGVDYFVANTGGEWVRPGKNQGDQIGQFRNLLVWLRPADRPFFFQLPQAALSEVEDGIWFFRLEKTWLAVRPINLENFTPVTIPKEKLTKRYSQEQTYRANTTGHYAGFALEVGEAESGSYDSFKQSVKANSELNLTKLSAGEVLLQSTDGNTLRFVYDLELPLLVRNGEKRNWFNFALYSGPNPERSPISLGWKEGQLAIETLNSSFQTSFE
ncbi:MAG: hypothetical protein ACFB4I_24485 [Cyanophyceae cyanobacterium]